MQYQIARTELQSPPATLSYLGLFTEALILVATAIVLTALIGG